jgi:hypothetical protein
MPRNAKSRAVMHGPWQLSMKTSRCLFFVFLGRQHFTTIVRTAVRADLMRRFVFVTVLADHQVQGSQMVVCTPLITTRFGNFSLGQRTHKEFSFAKPLSRQGPDNAQNYKAAAKRLSRAVPAQRRAIASNGG